MGYAWGVRYQVALCAFAFLSMVCFVVLQSHPWTTAICLLPFTAVGLHLRKVVLSRDPAALDPELKKLALSTFFIALLLYLVNYYFL
jgi:1,4-dihydroxy-2-naphthoate octaprenyltransferase